MLNPIKITRGNGYWLDIPIEKIAKTPEGFVIEKIDLTTWKACTVNLVRKKVQYPVEFEFVDSTKGAVDGVYNVLRIKVNPNDFGRGLHGVEILALNEDDINIRFYDDEVIEFVETTAEADIPENVEFNISQFDLAPMAIYIPTKGDKGDKPVMSAEVVGSEIRIFADGEKILTFDRKPEGGWSWNDMDENLQKKLDVIDEHGMLLGEDEDFSSTQYGSGFILVQNKDHSRLQSISFSTDKDSPMKVVTEGADFDFKTVSGEEAGELKVNGKAVALKDDIPATTIKVANISRGLTSAQYAEAVAMWGKGIMPCFYDETSDYVWQTTYYTGKGNFYVSRTPIDEGKVTGATLNVNSFSQKAEFDLKTIKDKADSVSGKQDKLVSGTNIKTVNGESLLGGGNIEIKGGGGSNIDVTSLLDGQPMRLTMPELAESKLYAQGAMGETEIHLIHTPRGHYLHWDSAPINLFMEDIDHSTINRGYVQIESRGEGVIGIVEGTERNVRIGLDDVDVENIKASIEGVSTKYDGEIEAVKGDIDINAQAIIKTNADVSELRGKVGDLEEGKQDVISDLDTIRNGAAKGATAVQPVEGKGLSSNDYTNEDKQKLSELEGWYGTQAEFEALEEYTEGMLYYIIDDGTTPTLTSYMIDDMAIPTFDANFENGIATEIETFDAPLDEDKITEEDNKNA